MTPQKAKPPSADANVVQSGGRPGPGPVSDATVIGAPDERWGEPKPAIPFTTSDLIDPNLKRRFNNVAELDAEHKNVRIWGGIHFRNSLDVGDEMGKKIAAHLLANSVKPVR